MANSDNLMSAEELNARLTPEKRKKNAQKAGKKSGQVRKQQAELRRMMNMWLDEEHPTKKMVKLLEVQQEIKLL